MEFLKDFSAVLASVILGIIGFGLSVYHHKNSVKLAKQQHNNAFELQKHQFEKEMFEKFNSKYDKLNDSLNWIANNLNIESLSEMEDTEKANSYNTTIIDYFNLCSEQYFWYRKGRIDKDVWKAWYSGMNYYYTNSELVKSMWQKEIKNEGYVSYYLEKGDHLFKEYEKEIV